MWFATLRCSRVSLRSCGVHARGPRWCNAPRRPNLHALRAKFANVSPDFFAGNVSLPGLHIATLRCSRVSLRSFAACSDAAHGAAPRRSVESCPRRVPIRKLFCPFSAGSASLPGRPPCLASLSRPSPAASLCAVAHDVVISPCALRHRVVCESCSGIAPCKDPAHLVAPRRGVKYLPAPRAKFAAVVPILRRQRLVARPAALPHVFIASVARGPAVRCCTRRCDLAVRFATSGCSCVSLQSCAVQRCGPRCRAAPRLPKLPAPRAKSLTCPPTLRRQSLVARPAALLTPRRLPAMCPRPHGALLRTTL